MITLGNKRLAKLGDNTVDYTRCFVAKLTKVYIQLNEMMRAIYSGETELVFSLHMQITNGLCRIFHVQNYKEIAISRTLYISNFPLTGTKNRFPSSAKRCNFTSDFSNWRSFQTNFCLSWRMGFHCWC